MITHIPGTTKAKADYRDRNNQRHRITEDHVQAELHEFINRRNAWASRTAERLRQGKDLRCRQLGTTCRRKAIAPHPENGKPTCSRHFTL